MNEEILIKDYLTKKGLTEEQISLMLSDFEVLAEIVYEAFKKS
ncbi:MAG: hypothetical protein ACK4NC_04275 [Candidatus Gracilibacteria bacterium]